jgi:hypothetical protein
VFTADSFVSWVKIVGKQICYYGKEVKVITFYKYERIKSLNNKFDITLKESRITAHDASSPLQPSIRRKQY